MRSHQEATEGGGPETDELTSFDQQILDIIKKVSVEGHTNISESDVDFSFDIPNINSGNKPLPSNIASSVNIPEANTEEIQGENTSSKSDLKYKRKIEVRKGNISSVKMAPRKKLLNAAQASESYRLSLEKKNDVKK